MRRRVDRARSLERGNKQPLKATVDVERVFTEFQGVDRDGALRTRPGCRLRTRPRCVGRADRRSPGCVPCPGSSPDRDRGRAADDHACRLAARSGSARWVGFPEDIAAAVTFLSADESSYITGQTIYVDGGASLG